MNQSILRHYRKTCYEKLGRLASDLFFAQFGRIANYAELQKRFFSRNKYKRGKIIG
jgi:hypothetical protein